jgi:hypothetical protein
MGGGIDHSIRALLFIHPAFLAHLISYQNRLFDSDFLQNSEAFAGFRNVVIIRGIGESAMSEVYEIIRSAKSIPLDELVLRSSQPPEAVTHEVRMLAEGGLIKVKGDIPADANLLAHASGTIIMLTSKGISANTA